MTAGLAWIVSFAASVSAASLNLSQDHGGPTAPITVNGQGFRAAERVNIFFDTADAALVVTDLSGRFSGAINAPGSASPGTHWITAVGETSGRAAQLEFKVQVNWSQFSRGPKHQGHNEVENVLSPSTVGQLQYAWSVPTPREPGPPAIADGIAYVAESGLLTAVDVATGATRWTAPLGYQQTPSAPAVENGVVYVAIFYDFLDAFDAATGTLLWAARTGINYTSPAVYEGVVYVASADQLYAFSAATGSQIWSASVGRAFYKSSPAVADGMVFVGNVDGKLYAFNSATGAQVWEAKTGNGVWGSPAVGHGIVYVGSRDFNVYAFNSTTGALVWKTSTGSDLMSAPSVADGVVFMPTENGQLYALDAFKGSVLWIGTIGMGSGAAPAVANGVLYLGNPGLCALDATNGGVLWTASTGGTFESPAVVDGVLYASSISGLTAFTLPPSSPAAIRPVPRPNPEELSALH